MCLDLRPLCVWVYRESFSSASTLLRMASRLDSSLVYGTVLLSSLWTTPSSSLSIVSGWRIFYVLGRSSRRNGERTIEDHAQVSLNLLSGVKVGGEKGKQEIVGRRSKLKRRKEQPRDTPVPGGEEEFLFRRISDQGPLAVSITCICDGCPGAQWGIRLSQERPRIGPRNRCR